MNRLVYFRNPFTCQKVLFSSTQVARQGKLLHHGTKAKVQRMLEISAKPKSSAELKSILFSLLSVDDPSLVLEPYFYLSSHILIPLSFRL